MYLKLKDINLNINPKYLLTKAQDCINIEFVID